ncbi:FYVE, RhoGEF and PH domain-containing protein 6-like [Archocentrus centrarchus]|uniref:FYVE, RhoGEF and PH domain-containing protein 6-like n=1 Tax=Archocentrus centrarchus TaxID=63155 RepID=UPI0011E9D529|nr:FYVE, RhoGEF and PH domain-containing protein 6-like [Archocentrus centrarchus]
MSSGMQKPAVAPKPKLSHCESPWLSPLMPRKADLSHPSPGTQRKPKPALAPKPCHTKFTPAVEAKQPVPTSLHQTSVLETPQTVGRLISQNGLQQEAKLSHCHHVVSICLCNDDPCTCLAKTPTNREKIERDLKALHNGKSEKHRKIVASYGTCDNRRGKTDNAECQEMNTSYIHNHLTNYQSVQETSAIYQNLSIYSVPKVTVWPAVPCRTRSDEANDEILKGVPGQVPEEDALGVPQPKVIPAPPRKSSPVPVPRKPRQAVQDRQEKVVKEREEPVSQDGGGINIIKVGVSSERKGTSSLSVSAPCSERKQTVFLSAKTCAPPAPPLKKKPILSQLDKVPTSATQTPPKDIKEEYFDCDAGIYEMDLSALMKNKKIQKKAIGEQEEADSKHTYYSPRSVLLSQPVVPARKTGMVKVPPKKPQRKKNLMALNQNKESEEREVRDSEEHEKRNVHHLAKGRLFNELPFPHAEKSSSNLLGAELTRHLRSSLSKAKSFSGADNFRSKKLQKANSLRKPQPLKFSMSVLSRQIEEGDQIPDSPASDNKQSVDDNNEGVWQNYPEHHSAERKYPGPFIGVEQNVDGEEDIEALPSEDIPLYEEIDNVNVGQFLPSSQAFYSEHNLWQCSMYVDPQTMYPFESSVCDSEGIYEEQDPFIPPEIQTPAYLARSSFDKEVVLEVPSEEDPDTSGEEGENDCSSNSSKGDLEQPEESKTEIEKKKNKIYNIAKEIMTSESVFVDVLKLLHVDFRDAVSKASRQNGKPVIEDRFLNQILYSLPQLYELNESLLFELRERIEKWNEHAQVADIFLKKGPYLKMYSTYIREFDRNVALLDEQTKKNPAFATVVREFESSPRCANLALKHYLLKPVQRIPQYQLLLTDYLKNLPEGSDDYNDTEAALTTVKEVASHANDFMKQGDNFQNVIRVQCRLIGHHEIVQPGRIYLKEGILMKLSRKVMQPRMFFLFSDMLLYTKPVQSGQFMFKNMLPLKGMKVSKPSQEAYQNELNIVSVERSFILSARSAKEQDEWLEAISTAISEYIKKTISFIPGKLLDGIQVDGGEGAPLGSKAPIWIPDKRVSMCMICTSKFTQTWRRHHCRACGKIVCQSCSTKESPLKYKKYKCARVCDQCFQVLQEQEGEKTESIGKKNNFTLYKKQKQRPAALKEVSANTNKSSMSGYLHVSKISKKQGKRLWFVIKDKVLYTYGASEDVAALESMPLLGFVVTADSPQTSQFKLYHQDKLYYIFKAESPEWAQRWINSFRQAAVL